MKYEPSWKTDDNPAYAHYLQFWDRRLEQQALEADWIAHTGLHDPEQSGESTEAVVEDHNTTDESQSRETDAVSEPGGAENGSSDPIAQSEPNEQQA